MCDCEWTCVRVCVCASSWERCEKPSYVTLPFSLLVALPLFPKVHWPRSAFIATQITLVLTPPYLTPPLFLPRYLCSMDDPVELKDYVAGLLENAGSKAVAKFTRDFIQRRSGVVAGIQVRPPLSWPSLARLDRTGGCFQGRGSGDDSAAPPVAGIVWRRARRRLEPAMHRTLTSLALVLSSSSAALQTPAMTTYKKAEDEVAAAQASALAASSAAGGSTAAAQAGAQGAQAGTRGAPSDVSHAPASTAAAGKSENADTSQSKTTTKKKKKKKATAAAAAPPADGEAGEAASAADEEDIPAWAAESNATMMSSFFASKAMPQLKSASKSISEVESRACDKRQEEKQRRGHNVASIGLQTARQTRSHALTVVSDRSRPPFSPSPGPQPAEKGQAQVREFSQPHGRRRRRRHAARAQLL